MTRRAAIPLLVAAMLFASLGVAAAQTTEEPEPAYPKVEPVRKLRLMLLDLSDLKEPKTEDTFVPPARGYTHTFGSQRKSEVSQQPRPLINPEALEADVVVLHGVADAKAARRLFPARDWRFLLSRPASEKSPAKGDGQAGKPSSAIALWLQPGVRFGGADMGAPPGLGATLRLTSGLGTLWVLSPAEPCTSAAAGAPGALCKPLEDWVTAKIAAGDMVLVGGVLPPAKIVDTSASPPAPAAAVPEKLAKAGAASLGTRRQQGLVQITAADAGGRCGGAGQASSTVLHLRLAKDNPAPIRWSGYFLPLEPVKSPSTAASQTPPPARAPSCALVLDIEAMQ